MIKDNPNVEYLNLWTFEAQYYDVYTGEDNGKISFKLDRNNFVNDLDCYMQAMREAFINGDENDGLFNLKIIALEE